MASTDLGDRVLVQLLHIHRPSVERHRTTQLGASQVEEVADHSLHPLRTREDAGHHPSASLGVVFRNSKQGGPCHHGTERGPQIMANYADELIAKSICVKRE